MPAWRRILAAAVSVFLLAACSDEDGPEPVGIMWGSGASGAFVGDTVSLVVFYRDAAGDPIGLPRPSLVWTSSNAASVSITSESTAVALDTGSAILTARTAGASPYSVEVQFRVVPPFAGRLVWSRQAQPGEQPGIAVRNFASQDVRQLPDIGYPGAGSGDPYLSHDASRVAVTGTRPVAPLADRTVFIVDAVSGQVTAPFDSVPGHQFSGAWFPGDTLLAFLMITTNGAVEVFTARSDGSAIEPRTSLGQQFPPFFDVTPEGTFVLELRSGGPSDLFEVALTGDTVRRLTSTPDYNESGVSVSPNGALVAYNALRVGDNHNHVWIANRNGSAPRRLLSDRHTIAGVGPPFFPVPAAEEGPSWTPDGEWVLLSWSIDPHLRADGRAYDTLGDLYVIRLSDGLAVRLTRSRTIDGQPVFR